MSSLRVLRRAMSAVAVAAVLAVGATPAAADPTTTPGGAGAPEYWLSRWHVPQLWAAGVRGQDVSIAEIDTGVDAALPELAGRVGQGIDFGPAGGNGQIDRDTAAYGHGTAMATIMVGRPGPYGIRGLAPDATVLPIAVPLAGTLDQTPATHLAAAIRWATSQGADIISMALGGVRTRSAGGHACPVAEQQAIFAALRAGEIVLAAGGNRGATDNAVEEPGVCLGVVTVGALDRDGQVARFSSRHPYLTLTAPGVNVPSIGPGDVPYSGDGTSQATALASAAAALVWSKYPQLTARQVVARLLATLDDPRARPSPSYGYGELDVYRAVTADVPTDAPNPVFALADAFAGSSSAPESVPRSERRLPAPTASARRFPRGVFRVASRPTPSDARVPEGLAIAAGGLFLLLLVGFRAAWRRSRRPPQPGARA